MRKTTRRVTALFLAALLCLTAARALSLEDALELVEIYYVDEVPDTVRDAETLDELFYRLGDPYSYYMDAWEYGEFTNSVESETSVTGIGASIEYRAEGILILSVLDGGGAQEAGLRAGDLITAVNGVSCENANESHRAMILGEPDTTVELTVRHEDGTSAVYPIVRRLVEVHNTTVTLTDGGAGWIDCNSFGTQTGEYFREGVAAFADEANYWVVDLRDNSGGLSYTAAEALGAFTGPRVQLYFRDRDGTVTNERSYWPALAGGKPVVVLVNGMSASASEIFAGGIRAEGTGIVVGTRTYGKGTAQIILDGDFYPSLFDEDAVKLTVYRFYCADGNTTDRLGVIPTLCTEDAEAVAALLDTAEADGALRFTLNGCAFSVVPDAGSDAFAALLSALPPDVELAWGGERLTPEEAAERFGVPLEPRRFDDLDGNPYRTLIDTLGVYQVLFGDGTGQFHPDELLTRAELCAMLAQALNVTAEGVSFFSDCADGDWFSGDVSAMAMMGFVEGVGDGRFDPSGTLTQEQFVTVMGRLCAFLNPWAESGAEEAAGFSGWAQEGARRITQFVTPEGRQNLLCVADMDARASVSRAEAAATLASLLEALEIIAY